MIGNLESVMKMNGTFNSGNSSHYIDELNLNFNSNNERQISSFRALVNTTHGIEASIDGVATRVLIKEQENKIIVSGEIDLMKNGSLVKVLNKHNENEIYLITGRLIDKTDYIEAEARLCNQVINTKRIKGIPCYFNYTLDEINNSDKIYQYEGKAKIYIQKPNIEDLFKLNSRIVFNNSKNEIFEVTDINSSEFKNVFVLLVQKTEYMNEDNLIDNIGYEPSNNEEIEEDVIPFIFGEDRIKFGTEYEYRSNIDDVEFMVDGNLRIIDSSANTCIITAIEKRYSKSILSIIKDGKALTSKDIVVNV